jgi:hypothetical protein
MKVGQGQSGVSVRRQPERFKCRNASTRAAHNKDRRMRPNRVRLKEKTVEWFHQSCSLNAISDSQLLQTSARHAFAPAA